MATELKQVAQVIWGDAEIQRALCQLGRGFCTVIGGELAGNSVVALVEGDLPGTLATLSVAGIAVGASSVLERIQKRVED